MPGNIQPIIDYMLVVLSGIVACFIISLLFVHLFSTAKLKRLDTLKKQILAAVDQYLNSGSSIMPMIDHFRTHKGLRALELVLRQTDMQQTKALQKIIVYTGYFDYMKKEIDTDDVMFLILLIKIIGQLHLPGFSKNIMSVLLKYQKDSDAQYFGFLSLSLLGDSISLIAVLTDKSYTPNLSFRSLQEIFSAFTGDKEHLFGVLLESATDKYIQRTCIKRIGAEKIHSLVGLVCDHLDDPNTNMLIDSIRTLGELKYRPAAEKILSLTKHPQWEVRNVAYTALAGIDLNLYAHDVAFGLFDREWWVRYNSATALVDYSKISELKKEVDFAGDRFAIEILNYALDRKALGKGVTVNA